MFICIGVSVYCILSLFSFSFFCVGASFLFVVSLWALASKSYFMAGPSLLLDEVSLLLAFVTCLVILTSLVSFSRNFSLDSILVFLGLSLCSFGVFCSSSLFALYVFYEASLIPISYAIVRWGSYPERGLSSLMMLVFTSLFTFPFMLLVVFYLGTGSSCFVLLPIIDPVISFFGAFWVFLSFSVKLPIYGVHYWLPIAHVEAPTFGSIILAGLLLKIGGCGLLRFSFFFSTCFGQFIDLLLVYLLSSVVVASVVCCAQADFNRLVAYSSVVHMTLAALSLLMVNSLSPKISLMLLVYHGVVSPLIFYLVGVLYSTYSTRLFILIRGLVLSSPFLVWVFILAFLYGLPAPPFPSFFSEVYLFVSISHVTLWALGGVFAVVFIALVYNLYWLVSVCFVSSFKASAFPSGAPLVGTAYLVCLTYSAAIIGTIWFGWLF